MPNDKTIPKSFGVNLNDTEKWYRNASYMPRWLRTNDHSDEDGFRATAAGSTNLQPIVLTTGSVENAGNQYLRFPSQNEMQGMHAGLPAATAPHAATVSSIIVLFHKVKYRGSASFLNPITEFTNHEKEILRQTIDKFISYSKILVRLCDGHESDKYAILKSFIDNFPSERRNWLNESIHKLHYLLINPKEIITFIDCRHREVIRIAAENPVPTARKMKMISSHESIPIDLTPELRVEARLGRETCAWQLNFYDACISVYDSPPIGIPLEVYSDEISFKSTFNDRANKFLTGLINDVIGPDYCNGVIDAFSIAIDIDDAAQ